jgi:hypothetical protein
VTVQGITSTVPPAVGHRRPDGPPAALPPVVACAGGLRVALRGAVPPSHLHPAAIVRVEPVAPVVLPEARPVEARRSDGVVWRRHWPEPDRLVAEFTDLAVVEVREDCGLVVFDRALPADTEEHLLLDHVLPLILARRRHLVLHGGVISWDGQAAVLVGSPGAGKSTLTAYAWQHGWSVGGDDGAVLHATEPPGVEPTYATIRVTASGAGLLGIDLAQGSGVVGKTRIAGHGARAFRQERVDLRVVAVVEPVGADVAAGFVPLGGIDAHAELFGSTFHADLSDRGGTLPTVVRDLATIVEATVVGRLLVPRGTAGLAEAERLLRHLVVAGAPPC